MPEKMPRPEESRSELSEKTFEEIESLVSPGSPLENNSVLEKAVESARRSAFLYAGEVLDYLTDTDTPPADEKKKDKTWHNLGGGVLALQVALQIGGKPPIKFPNDRVKSMLLAERAAERYVFGFAREYLERKDDPEALAALLKRRKMEGTALETFKKNVLEKIDHIPSAIRENLFLERPLP